MARASSPASTIESGRRGVSTRLAPIAAEVSVYFAAAAERGCSGCLGAGRLCTRYAALGAFVLMATAVYSLQVVGGYGGTWNANNYDLPAFAAIIALCVAADAWRRTLAAPRLSTARRASPRRTGAATSRAL